MSWQTWWDYRRVADLRLGIETPDIGEDWEDEGE